MRTDGCYVGRHFVVAETAEMLAEDIDERQVRRHPLDVIGTSCEDAPALGASSASDLGQ